MIAALNIFDVGPYCLDDSGRLVAQNNGQGVRVGAVLKVEVRVTNACGYGTHQDFAGTRVRRLHLLYLQRLIYFPQNRSFHLLDPFYLLRRRSSVPNGFGEYYRVNEACAGV